MHSFKLHLKSKPSSPYLKVHRDVMEKYGPFFQPGSAFVLKNVIVIATERNSYMIVTLNNLVKLYKVKCPLLVSKLG